MCFQKLSQSDVADSFEVDATERVEKGVQGGDAGLASMILGQRWLDVVMIPERALEKRTRYCVGGREPEEVNWVALVATRGYERGGKPNCVAIWACIPDMISLMSSTHDICQGASTSFWIQ